MTLSQSTMMKTDEIRQSYLSFFEKKAHKRLSSDSLVPQGDPTLLFTGAGMNQFKEYFLGLKKDMKRATTSQKCLRTGDLEEVGRTAYHHSFFEMLGNFSFGDYFKKEAIAWAWEYLTEVLSIPAVKLRVTVHESDDEAYSIWRNDIGLSEDRVYRMGDKSNFWPSNAPKDGPNGPCGPCSEIYFDMGDDPEAPAKDLESQRFAEIWNLVFTQYDRRDGGALEPLANRNIDTGMGLERLACVLQNKKTNFEIDLFQPILAAIKKELGVTAVPAKNTGNLYAIADHIRAIVFCMHDGVLPGNEGRGYVIRKIVRRALWHAHQIVPDGEVKDAFLYRVVPVVCDVMKNAYPELADSLDSTASTLKAEEERFLMTLETGLKILQSRLDELKNSGAKALPGKDVFELYDTYGFPEELTSVIAETQGFSVDKKEFEKHMDAQRERAKSASRISGSIFSSTAFEEKVLALPKTDFLGYSALDSDAKVLLADLQGDEGVLILDQSPFYGESGGQAGDKGSIRATGFQAEVVDTQKKDDRLLHVIKVTQGSVKAGDTVSASVDKESRCSTMRNHTATHLLHAALRKVLGAQVRQLGSLVNSEKLRFDYSYSEALTRDQIQTIEDEINREILADTQVDKEELPIETAKKSGAIAFFGDKYGEKVRVLTIGDYSKEFCGGTHCDRTGQIGAFMILADSSVASGTRRIEALTGTGAIAYMRGLREDVARISGALKTSPAGLEDRIIKLQEKVKQLEKEKKQTKVSGAELKLDRRECGGLFFGSCLASKGTDAGAMRSFSDALRSGEKGLVYLIAAENGEKINYVLGCTSDIAKGGVNLKELFGKISHLLEGSGGGRPDLVQGGARNNGQLQKSWKDIIDTAVSFLKERNKG